MWYVQHAIYRAFKAALLNAKYTLFFPPKFECLVFQWKQKSVESPAMIFHIPENCRLQAQWSSLTKDMEAKRFLRDKYIVQSASNLILYRSLSQCRYKKKSVSYKNIRKKYSICILKSQITNPSNVAILCCLWTHSLTFLHNVGNFIAK